MAEQKETVRRLTKSRTDKMVDGVCGGVAEYFHVDSTVVRIVWIIGALFGLGIVAYFLGMVFFPVDPEAKKTPPAAKSTVAPGVLWGAALIIIGFFFLSRRLDFPFFWEFPFGFHIGRMWHWKIFWPLAAIAFGIGYMIWASQRKSEPSKSPAKTRRLLRSSRSKVIGGVCGGLADYLSLDPTLIRIAVAVLALTHLPFWAILYLVCLLIIPQESAGNAS